MRITGGKACGIQLSVPHRKEIRPATDFMREQVFNRLQISMEGLHVLDCFAGTGAYGLECLSRGCQSVYFLERDSEVVKTLKENCLKVCKSAQADFHTSITIFITDVLKASWDHLTDVQLIFSDPPYRFWREMPSLLLQFLQTLAQKFPSAVLALEKPEEVHLPQHLLWTLWNDQPLKKKARIGHPSLSLYKCH